MACFYCAPFRWWAPSDLAEGFFLWPQLGTPCRSRAVGCFYCLGSLRRSRYSQQNPWSFSDLDRHGRHDLVPILVDHDNPRPEGGAIPLRLYG
jgi:hypothetical protein